MAQKKLSQILAAAATLVDAGYRKLTDYYNVLRAPGNFSGFSKTYTPVNEGDTVLPSESKRAPMSVYEILNDAKSISTQIMDAKYEWEKGNSVAKGTLVFEGKTYLVDAPVGFLLALEKHVDKLLTTVSACPTLNFEKEWSWDSTNNHWNAAPQTTHRTIKEETWMAVLGSGNPEKGLANTTQKVEKQTMVGIWTNAEYATALSPAQKTVLVDRLNAFKAAVKAARENANSTLVETPPSVSALFEDLLRV